MNLFKRFKASVKAERIPWDKTSKGYTLLVKMFSVFVYLFGFTALVVAFTLGSNNFFVFEQDRFTVESSQLKKVTMTSDLYTYMYGICTTSGKNKIKKRDITPMLLASNSIYTCNYYSARFNNKVVYIPAHMLVGIRENSTLSVQLNGDGSVNNVSRFLDIKLVK